MSIPDEPSSDAAVSSLVAFSLPAGGEIEDASSAEPHSRGARVHGEGERKKKRSDGDVDRAKRRPKTKKPPQQQNHHWATSLARGAGGPLPVVLLGLGVAVATVTVARAVAAASQQQQKGKRKSKELNKEGSFDSLRLRKERPDPVWKDEQVSSSSTSSSPLRRALSRTFSSSSSPRSSSSSSFPSSFTLPAVPEGAQTLLDISLPGTTVRQLWRLALTSDARLQRRFMESRGNEGLEVESGGGGSGWRVREEEEGEEEGEKEQDKRRRCSRKRFEVRTRVLSYVTPIGGGGGGGGGGGSARASQSGDGNDDKAPPHHHHHHRFRKTTPCRESWLCSQRSDEGFLATAVVRTPRVPFGERFYTELTWAAARERGKGGASSTTRLRVTGRVVFERAIPVPGLKTVITRAVAEGLKESYGEYRRLLLEEVEGKADVVAEEKKTKKRTVGKQSSKPLLFFVLLLLAALLLFLHAVAPLARQQLQLQQDSGKGELFVFASVERWLCEVFESK